MTRKEPANQAWITDRLPTAKDANGQKCVWSGITNQPQYTHWTNIKEGHPWMPAPQPEPCIEASQTAKRPDTSLEASVEWMEENLGNHPDVDPDHFNPTIAAAREVEKLRGMIQHCNSCGGSWLNDGLTDGCRCKLISELQKECGKAREKLEWSGHVQAALDECLDEYREKAAKWDKHVASLSEKSFHNRALSGDEIAEIASCKPSEPDADEQADKESDKAEDACDCRNRSTGCEVNDEGICTRCNKPSEPDAPEGNDGGLPEPSGSGVIASSGSQPSTAAPDPGEGWDFCRLEDAEQCTDATGEWSGNHVKVWQGEMALRGYISTGGGFKPAFRRRIVMTEPPSEEAVSNGKYAWYRCRTNNAEGNLPQAVGASMRLFWGDPDYIAWCHKLPGEAEPPQMLRDWKPEAKDKTPGKCAYCGAVHKGRCKLMPKNSDKPSEPDAPEGNDGGRLEPAGSDEFSSSGSLSSTNAPDPGEGWRLLEIGEVKQENDEVYLGQRCMKNDWMPLGEHVCGNVHKYPLAFFRRRIVMTQPPSEEADGQLWIVFHDGALDEMSPSECIDSWNYPDQTLPYRVVAWCHKLPGETEPPQMLRDWEPEAKVRQRQAEPFAIEDEPAEPTTQRREGWENVIGLVLAVPPQAGSDETMATVMFEDGPRSISTPEEVAELRSSKQHTEQWYATRWARLQDWVESQPLLTESDKQEASCIMANAVANSIEPPTYDQQMNTLRHEVAELRQERDELRMELITSHGETQTALEERDALQARVDKAEEVAKLLDEMPLTYQRKGSSKVITFDSLAVKLRGNQ